MTTHEARALYSELLDGELPPEELARWHERVVDDPELAADYAGFAASVGALRGLRPAALSEARVAALMAHVEGDGAGAAPLERPARWPRAVAALLSAAAVWWLFAFGGWGFLVERPERTDLVEGEHVAWTPGASHDPHTARDGLAPFAAPDTPRDSAPLAGDAAPRDPIAAETAGAPRAPVDAPSVQLAAGDPAPTRVVPTPGLHPLDIDTRRPRLRGSADLRLVRGDASTRLTLRGEVGAVIPELLTLLDDADAELAQLAAARLALLQDELVTRELLPEALGVHPMLAAEQARPTRGGWFASEPEPPSPSEVWHAWWDAARAHLPPVHDSDVL